MDIHIVVDSGSTKSDWHFISPEGEPIYLQSPGYNPYYQGVDEISTSIGEQITPEVMKYGRVSHIYYYGTGCSSQDRCGIIKTALAQQFPEAKVHVTHDIMGAARSLCGNEQGIVCILGTGTNVCLYNGQKITKGITSLGYLGGDEGSASYLGRLLLKAYYYNTFPEEIAELFKSTFKPDQKDLVQELFDAEKPNIYLGSFVPFLSKHIEYPEVRAIVEEGFEDFTKRLLGQFAEFQELPVHFTGSIAYHFRDVLKEVLAYEGFQLGNVVAKPINGLMHYHLKEYT